MRTLSTLTWQEETPSGEAWDCSLRIAHHAGDQHNIFITIPGVDGSLDGYQDKYKHIAESISNDYGHTVYQMDNPYISRHHWESNLRTLLAEIYNNHEDVTNIVIMAHSAGGPIAAIRNPEPFRVPRSMLSGGSKHYALRVSGTSMIEEGISDGDVVILRDQQSVDDGEKAVAYLPDQDSVTLKKIYHENGKVKLVPANQTMKPFYEDNVEIQGKVVGVIRSEA